MENMILIKNLKNTDYLKQNILHFIETIIVNNQISIFRFYKEKQYTKKNARKRKQILEISY